ncbi:Abnormal spindle-like microcephaly-assoc'd, ASPM-SPD-2-Hydin [Granulicella rosea]|uniref:Abnormal spindle-like microcephaly-assoc'd, ASPM-SPD-2-Hydin n=1 Tax=Granulicella rosea TaxID=474952 RepID=A0A239EFG4_9BACT|nr:choice-of-anchor D domain-containing protein [Granulicella rosea]SNS42632.1 Abnormal spindle-like microcephaly-assoc'd, ASPM-SPD-2-Hydin [Granulicella rosea]
MPIHARSLAFVYSILLTILALASTASPAQTAAPPPSRETAKQTLLRRPLYFEPAADGAMTRRSPAGTMRLDAGGATQFATPGKAAISLTLDGANAAAMPRGEAALPGRSHYLLGNDPAQWRTGVSQFSRVRVPAVYPGIDLVYYGNGSQLEHDYLLAPNADPALIRMRFQGAATSPDQGTGDLVLRQTATAGARNEAMRLLKPVAYQQAADGAKMPVPVSYRLLADGDYGFALGDYDHRQALIIDPVVVYGSYFGGKYNDSIVDLKVGSDGSLYLLLTTDSTGLKTVGATAGGCAGNCGPFNEDNGSSSTPDMYLAKFDSTFQTLIFATYLGGSASDQAYNLALDTDGSIYVAGVTQSTDFPIVNGYPGGTPATGQPFGTLTKLSPDGSTILYSTLIGYGQPATSYAPPVMATGNNGIVYVVGQSGASSSAGFIWKKNSLFYISPDFLAKLDTTKTGTDSVVYATYMGNDIEAANSQLASVAVDSKGDVWVHGQTKDASFPTTTSGAFQPQCKSNPCNSGFLMELDPTGASVLYATFLGGSTAGGSVTARDIVLDPSDNIYVSGYTYQGDFPTLNGYYTAIDGNSAGYISKFSPDGKTLLYSTFVPVGVEIGVSKGGQVAFAGVAGSGFPVKNNLPTPTLAPNDYDAVIGLIDTTQSFDSSLLLSSYLGTSTGYTQPSRVYLAGSGQVLIVGETSATDLPLASPYQSTPGGGTYDGFIAAIQPGASGSLTLTPTTLTFPSTSVGSTSSVQTATLSNSTAQSIYLLQGSLTDSKDFTQTDNCNGIIAPGASCTVSFTFTPQSTGTLTSTYTTADLNNQATKLTVALSGPGAAPPNATFSPTTLAFGSVADGQSATLSTTLTNGGSLPLSITGASVTGAGFALTNNGCGASVGANGSCQYTVSASPTTPGPITGTLTVVDSLGTQTVQLTATGSSTQETLSPATVNFGNAYVGSGAVATQVVTFTNSGSAPVTISGTVFNPTIIFSVVSTTCQQQVAAGASCTYTLGFVPFGVGSVQGTFTVTDGSSNPSVALAGTGLAAQDGDVFLLPGSIDFQDVLLYTNPSIPVILSNQTSQTIQVARNNPASNIAIQGTDAQAFNYTDCQLNLTTIQLAPGASCKINVGFGYGNIAADTHYNAQLTVNWNYLGQTQLHTLATALTANTISSANAIVTPSSIQFPGTAAGATSPAQVVTVTSTGDQPLGFTTPTFSGTNPTAFAQTNNCPASIAKGVTCQISVTFKPDASATQFTANLNLGLSAYSLPVSLSGSTNPTDFVLSSTSGTQGPSNPSWVINVAPLTAAGFNQPITFTATGLDPSFGTPVFNPPSVTPNGGSTATTVTLAPPVAGMKRPPLNPRQSWPILACFALCLPLARKLKSVRGRKILLVLICIAAGGIVLPGCGVNLPPVNFTVTATSGTITHTITLTYQQPNSGSAF